jgi:hypothetical protein
MALTVRFPRNSVITKTYLAIAVGGVKVPPMLDVIKWPYTRKVNLRPLAIRTPLLTPLLYAALEFRRWYTINVMYPYALPLRPVNLSPHGLVLMLGVDFSGVQSFLGSDNKRTPTKSFSEIRLSLSIDTAPYWFEGKSIQLLEVTFDHTRNLILLAQWAPKGDCEAILRYVPCGSTGFLMSPYGPGRVEP